MCMFYVYVEYRNSGPTEYWISVEYGDSAPTAVLVIIVGFILLIPTVLGISVVTIQLRRCK